MHLIDEDLCEMRLQPETNSVPTHLQRFEGWERVFWICLKFRVIVSTCSTIMRNARLSGMMFDAQTVHYLLH